MLFCRLNLEEELDQMKVHRSVDKATIQELNLCLQQEREGKLSLSLSSMFLEIFCVGFFCCC